MTPHRDSLAEYFRILEIPRGALPEDIKISYRRLIKVWHPDRFQHDVELCAFAEQRTKAINIAYEAVCHDSLEEAAGIPAIATVRCADFLYNGSVVTQISEGEIPDPDLSEMFLEPVRKLANARGVKLMIAENTGTATGVAMQFDVEKRVIWLSSPNGFRPEAPIFAISTILARDMVSEKGAALLRINQGLQFAGWDGHSKFPEQDYVSAEYRLCKRTAEVCVERIIKQAPNLMKDLRVWAIKRNLDDVARFLSNKLFYGTWRP